MAPELRKRLTREDLLRIIEESERAKCDANNTGCGKLLHNVPPKKKKVRHKKVKVKKLKTAISDSTNTESTGIARYACIFSFV